MMPDKSLGIMGENVQWCPSVKTYPGGVVEFVIDRVPKDKLSIKESRSK